MPRKTSLLLKTLATLAVLNSATIITEAQSSPRNVLAQFCELDTEGKQLTAEGWKQIASLFTAPSQPTLRRAIVVKDFVVSLPAHSGKRAEFYVEYIELGELDLSLVRFSRLPQLKHRRGFDLVLGDLAGSTSRQSSTPSSTEWRIEGTPPEPRLTVTSAIRYVDELQNKTPDPVARENARTTLAALKRLQ